MDFLTTNDLRAEDLDFGKDDAESDDRLKDWFLETSDFKNVMRLEYSLILGQKGSGKSAILRMLHERAKEMVIIDLSPQQYQWQNLRGSQENGIPSPHAESLVWTASLTISLMNFLVQNANNFDDSKQIIPQFRKFLVDMKKLIGKESMPEQFWRWVKSGPTVSAKGVQVALPNMNPPKSDPVTLNPKFQEQIDNLKIFLSSQNKVFLLTMDRLDEVFQNTEASKNLLVGLLISVKSFNTMSRNAKTLVFLRSDIYRSLVFSEKDKYTSEKLSIVWNQDSISAMISKRISESVRMKGIQINDTSTSWLRAFPESVPARGYAGKKNSFDYICERTFLRPRDIILFCRLAKRSAERTGHIVILPEDIKKAENEYSKEKVDLVTSECKPFFSSIEKVLEALRGQKTKYSKAELNQLFSSIQSDSEEIIRKCVESNILGVMSGKKKAPVYYFEESSIVNALTGIDPNEPLLVFHKAIHEGLSLYPPRTAQEEPSKLDIH